MLVALLLPGTVVLACEGRDLPTAPATHPGPQLDVVPAAATELYFSEYIEGTSNNKALEIHNGTGGAVDLAAGGYNVQMFFNGSATAGLTINLTGTVADGEVFVLAHSSAVPTILTQADQTNGAGWFNGDDAVVLRKGTAIIDVIGQIGFDPGTEWGSSLISTADNTLLRQAGVCAGDADGSDAFDPSVEWDGYATDTFDGLGAHTAACGEAAPAVASTNPTHGATGVPLAANLTVTFSEPVDVTGAWFGIDCTVSGTHTAGVTGGPTSFTLDPAADFASADACTVTILAAQVTDQDADDPPDNMAADHVFAFTAVDLGACPATYTPIPSIQGSGAASPLDGTAVTTRGIVVGDYEGPPPTLRGFYIQDPTGDGDAATSDGLFVFNGSDDDVALGNEVVVSGTVAEFQNQTQLESVTAVTVCGTGTVTPVDVTLPVPSADHLERYEGMLVRLPQTLFVTEHFQLGRFGQVTMSAGDRLYQPTSIAAPGPAALTAQAANDLNRIIIDDARNDQNADPILFGRGGSPLSASNTLRGGDAAAGIVGVLTYSWAGTAAGGSAYRVRPIDALGGGVPAFSALNHRPIAPTPVGGSLRVGSFNVLNYFNTFTGCTAGAGGALTLCRGAADATEFDRQWPKTVAAILGLGVDLLGIVEIENDGYGPGSAIADLVDRLNTTAGGGTWAFLDVDAATGQVNALGLDAIKVGLLYRPARVTPVGTTAVLNSLAFVNAGDPDLRNRPSLLQAFERPDGARFLVNVNHLKSKSGACSVPDAGDGQGECNAVRTTAAMELLEWFETDPTGVADDDLLILGDLNSYAMEDPIRVLTTGGFQNLLATFAGPNAYSFGFDGQWGYLDHALASGSLTTQVTAAATWHINADEPAVLDYNVEFKSVGHVSSLYAPDAYRSSDHDPIIIGLDLSAPLGSYDFTGFLRPIANPPAVNIVRAGRAVPIAFSLAGDLGMDVLEPGFPKSRLMACDFSVALGPMSSIATPGRSGLEYDVSLDAYTIVWKTLASWAGTCRELVVKLADGSVHRARFQLRR